MGTFLFMVFVVIMLVGVVIFFYFRKNKSREKPDLRETTSDIPGVEE